MRAVISDGRGSAYRHRKALKKAGFSYSGGEWALDLPDGCDTRKLSRAAARMGLSLKVYEEGYVRGRDYRAEFFRHDRGARGDGSVYRCAYCGRRMGRAETTVDHLVPVAALQGAGRGRYKRLLSRLGASGVNDAANLVPACARCNRKKGARTGIWVLRGRLGSTRWFWPAAKAGGAAIAAAAAAWTVLSLAA